MARSALVSEGFNSWKRVNDGEKCAFLIHVGSLSSSHNRCTKCVQDLMKPKQNIDKVLNAQSTEEIIKNRLRLKATIEGLLWLATQGCSFRGHDESKSSLNRGNFIELLKFQAHLNDEIAKVVLHNAPQNARYTSPQIQKEILHILANKVRTMIRDKLGDAKFCILVDEAQDESKKEQMSLIFRFVNNSGFLVERFFEILSVEDTTSANLKKSISDIFVQHNIQIHNMRGQGLTLVAAAKDVPSIWQFFSYLTSIVNFVISSPKHLSDLQSAQQEEIAYMLAIGECESGTGANQIGTLHRPGATRWSSHYDSVRNLIDMYEATCKILGNLSENGSNGTIRGEACDFQVMELNCKFSEATMELFALCSALDPTDSFKKFNMGDICKLASKFYPTDFTQQEIHALRVKLEHYQLDIVYDHEFQQISTLSALYREMIVTKKVESYVMIQRLIRLVLTLPVSTATTERAFSSMKFLKTTRCNKMGDDLLSDCMILYIERQLSEKIDLESVIDEFYTLKSHRAHLK
ncbi:zinc finger MYM-type protein 1-like [Zingiber officinale]|uniref:zinc finger MYM-type protein 1-like n=1 Tax=Zingiber officinale TaxID=94328 RepID=UPI001C4D29CE|nr:zinc finger MYM-type protein 1-like [Zingiber officinale]